MSGCFLVLWLACLLIVEGDDVVFLGESPPPLESLPGAETEL